MKRNWKALVVVLLMALALALVVGCRNEDDDQPADDPGQDQPAATPTPAPADDDDDDDDDDDYVAEDPPSRDLGGRHIVLGNWWGDHDPFTYEPGTLFAEEQQMHRLALFERYNFTMETRNIAGWGEYQELSTLSILAGDPIADIITFNAYWWPAMLAQGLFAPLPEHYDFHDRSVINWNRPMMEAGQAVDGTYFLFSNYTQIGSGVFWNFRLLEEAGIDPNLPFDLQQRGEWTWDAFLDLLRATTRDIDNTGVMDTWGIATFSSDILPQALASNGAQYVGRGADGLLYNATNTPQFLEALTFVNSLMHVENVMMPQPEGSEWNWFDYAFLNAEVAFRTSGHWMAPAINNNLADDFGFVVFPVGPSGDTHRFIGNGNVNAIPSTFAPDEVCDILFAWILWESPVPGFDDPDIWKAAAYLNHTSPRSVDESLVIARDPARMSPLWHQLVPGFDEGPNFSWRMWHEDSDPATIIEEAQMRINYAIDNANQR